MTTKCEELAHLLIAKRKNLEGKAVVDWVFPADHAYILMLKKLVEKKFITNWHLSKKNGKIVLQKGQNLFKPIRCPLDIAAVLRGIKEHPILTKNTFKRLEFYDTEGRNVCLGQFVSENLAK